MGKFLLFLISVIILTAPAAIFADDRYELLAPLGNLTEVRFGETSNSGPAPAEGLATYLSWVFKFFLAAAGILAVTQIVIAGVQKIASTASEKTRGDANERISGAVWGLVLALGSYLILNTINPDLVKSDFGLEAIKITVQDPDEIESGDYDGTVSRINEVDARARLSQSGIGVKNACSSGQNVGCVKLEGIRDSVLDELSNLKSQAPGVAVFVTGGTESGHADGKMSHGNGYKVDLRLNSQLDQYIMSNFKEAGTRSDGAKKWINPKTGAVYALETYGDPHWDVVSGKPVNQ